MDGLRLVCQQKQLICENGHSYDLARQGYVNLLAVQHKRSKDPGDSKEMVRARVDYLNSGFYARIAAKLAEITYPPIQDYADVCIMDAGCGDGYYTDILFNTIQLKKHNVSFIGLDISKHAIHEAAKRNKQINWVVGTNRQPPLVNNCVDVIVCVFGFHSFAGFQQILKPAARIILVEPGPNHLQELRELIYADVKKTAPADLSDLEEMDLFMTDVQALQFKTDKLDSQQINNLLLMTPHFFRANKQGRDAVSALEEIELSVDVVFRTLEKK